MVHNRSDEKTQTSVDLQHPTGEQVPATNIMGDETLVRRTAEAAPGEYPLPPTAQPPSERNDSGEIMTTKDEALAGIERERAAWEALLAEVGEGRMERPGVAGEWTFKDVVAHLSAWRGHTLARLEAAARGEPEPPAPWPAGLTEDDEINAWFHAAARDRSLADVLAESREGFARLARVIAALPETDLTDPHRFTWTEGEAIGPAIVDGSFFNHLHEEHEPGIRSWLA
jgi:hypothetical protein